MHDDLTVLAEAVNVLDPTPEPEPKPVAATPTPNPWTKREVLTGIISVPFIYTLLVGVMSLAGIE